MPRQIKALLVGITRYENAPSEDNGAQVATVLPSAQADVEDMERLLNNLGQSTGVQPQITKLLDGVEIRRKSILRALETLCQDADDTVQLVFYFSGHGMLRPRSLTEFDEVLCPSDINWSTSDGGISYDDFMDKVMTALTAGACIEVVLEACSASALTEGKKYKRLHLGSLVDQIVVHRFGCFFGGDAGPAGSGAVWNASVGQSPSYSGPVPGCLAPIDARAVRRDCSADPVRGLFTYLFCRHYRPGITRFELLFWIELGLRLYWEARNQRPCNGEMKEAQVPSLFALDVASTGIWITAQTTDPTCETPKTLNLKATKAGERPFTGAGIVMGGNCSRAAEGGACGAEIVATSVVNFVRRQSPEARKPIVYPLPPRGGFVGPGPRGRGIAAGGVLGGLGPIGKEPFGGGKKRGPL